MCNNINHDPKDGKAFNAELINDSLDSIENRLTKKRTGYRLAAGLDDESIYKFIIWIQI